MSDKKAQRFTIDADHDGAEVPTLTSLLYRKNLVKTLGPGGNLARNLEPPLPDTLEPTRTMTLTREEGLSFANPSFALPVAEAASNPPPLPLTEEPTGISLLSMEMGLEASLASPIVGMTEPGSPAIGRIVNSSTAKKGTLRALLPAHFAQIPEGPPVGAVGISELVKSAKLSAAVVFKTTQTAAPSSRFGVFAVVANTPPSAPANVWSGMEFAEADFSQIWQRMEKYGFAEFPKLGTAGDQDLERRAIRNAFQVGPAECLTLVRSQTQSGEQTLFAFLSESSIQAHLPNFQSSGMRALKVA
ncbi:MAG: hypothetical protein H7301_07750 [Cryobacterium sp.]|nr:hypothetical protein [Oligoflexia bacterium]